MLLNEVAITPTQFKALILAGPPASGKSTLYQIIQFPSNHAYLNTDTLRHDEAKRLGYQEVPHDREDPAVFGGMKDDLYKFMFNTVLHGDPIVFETVADNKISFERRVATLRAMGYDVGMIYTAIPEEEAKAREKKRREIEKRAVDHEFIEQVYKGMPIRLAEIAVYLGKDNFLYLPRTSIEYDPNHVKQIQTFTTTFFNKALQNDKGKEYKREMYRSKRTLLQATKLDASSLHQLISTWYQTTKAE